MLKQIFFRGQRYGFSMDFALLCACFFAEFETSTICHVLIISLGSFQYYRSCSKLSLSIGS